jgi:bifunctional NMN adenylyltransferase/nudix hydrolase
MKKPSSTPQYDVGIIVGRFQVPSLHEAHTELIRRVWEKHDRVIIFLGVAPVWVTRNNPLDFEARKQMILREFPELTVLYIKDTVSDNDWSTALDRQIADVVGPNQKVLLYGGRDSFLNRYTGKYATEELEPETYINVSGTEIRRQVSNKVKASPDFRAGVIWAAANQYTKVYPTVDVAVYDEKGRWLLARKPYETKFRFIGGFADSTSSCYENDARREVAEEAGVEVDGITYVGSSLIDDWRYRNEADKIKTILFKAKYIFGRPTAADDVCEVRWFETRDLWDAVVDEHRPLVELLLSSPHGANPSDPDQ